MKKVIALASVFVSWLVATALTQPAPIPALPERPILAGARVDPHVLATLERSCRNCHSANTEWPPYGRVFPLTLMLQRDVRMARSHMDLSRWPEYDEEKKRVLLAAIGAMVRNGNMPPARYTLLHPDAKLSPAEVNEIYQWTRSSRKLLTREPPESIQVVAP